jgi:hypothetical protein
MNKRHTIKSKVKLTNKLTFENITIICIKIKQCIIICDDIIESITRNEHISSQLVKVTYKKIREIMLEILNIILR